MASQINVSSNDKNIDVNVTTRGNINLETTRSINIQYSGVQKIIGGNNIQLTPSNGIGNVKIDVVGNISNVAYAANAGNVVNHNQPNITSVGTLTSLDVTNNITANNIQTNTVFHNDTGIAIQSNQWAQLQYTNTAIAPASQYDIGTGSWLFVDSTGAVWQSNTTGIVKEVRLGNDGSINSNGNVTAPYFIGNGSSLTSINGSNVTGSIPQSNYANIANSVAGANVSGYVANATHATISNIANVAYSVSASNVTGQVSNALVAGTVYTNAQPNITSVGTLTSLSLSGAITGDLIPSSNVTQNLGNTTNRWKDLYLSGSSIIIGSQTISATTSGISLSGTVNGDGGNLSNITGANVTGQVGNSLIAGTVYTNAQPNVTSVGTLTGLNVSGNVTVTGNLSVAGNISYVNSNVTAISDPVIELGNNANNQPLTNNDGMDRGEILHYYTTQPVNAFMGWKNGSSEFQFGSNVSVLNNVVTVNTYGNIRAQQVYANINGSNVIGNVGNAVHAYFSDSANSVAGANVSGSVSQSNYANIANSVAGANVSGAVAYATTANAVAGANVSGSVSQSNYANIANSVSGSNVSGPVAFATTANSVAGANVSGSVSQSNYANIANSVAVANVVGIGNIATINLNGSTTQVLYGNGVFATLSLPSGNGISNGTSNVSIPVSSGNVNTTVGGVANVLVVTTTGINVAGYINSTGNITGANASLGNLVTSNYFSGNGSLLTGINGANVSAVAQSNYSNIANSVSGSNVSGPVAFATTANSVAGANISGSVSQSNYANIANSVAGANVSGQVANALVSGTVYTAAQPNITSVGTLTSLSVTGNITAGNVAGGNLISGNYISGNGSLLTSINGANVSAVAQSNYANIANSVAGANVSGSVSQSNYANIANSVAGANVSGTVSSATTAGTVTTAAQPNITSHGSLIGLTVSNIAGVVDFTNTANVSLGAVGNLKITGGSASQYLQTDGTGNLSWQTVTGGGGSSISNGTSNVSIPVSSSNINMNVNATNVAVFTNTTATYNVDGVFSSANISSISNGTNAVGGIFSVIDYGNTQNATDIDFLSAQARGTRGSPTALGTGDILFKLNAYGYTGNGTATIDGITGWKDAGSAIASYVIELPTGANGAYTTESRLQAVQNNGNLAKAGLYGNGTFYISGGGGADGNLTIGNIAGSGTSNLANVAFTKYNEKVVAGGSTGAATLTPDAAAGTIYNYTLTGNITLSALGNAVAGTGMTIILTQDATGNRTLTSTMKFLGGTKTLSTSANAIDIMSVFYDGTTYYASLGKGFA
jgi:hypothetical protein